VISHWMFILVPPPPPGFCKRVARTDDETASGFRREFKAVCEEWTLSDEVGRIEEVDRKRTLRELKRDPVTSRDLSLQSIHPFIIIRLLRPSTKSYSLEHSNYIDGRTPFQ